MTLEAQGAPPEIKPSGHQNPPGALPADLESTSRLDVILLFLPALSAVVINLVLLALAIIKRESSVEIAAGIGALGAGALGMLAELTRRSYRSLGQVVQAGASTTRTGLATTTEVLRELSVRVDSVVAVGQELDRKIRHGDLLTRDEFYRAARHLADSAPATNRVIRVCNFVGQPPAAGATNPQALWFRHINRPEFGAVDPQIAFRRIQAVRNERSFQWVLSVLVDKVGVDGFSLAVLPAHLRDSPSYCTPLNAHSYYGQEAFILLPTGNTALSDSAVLHITSPEVVAALAHYHESLFSQCIALCEDGVCDVEACRTIASDCHYDAAESERLVDELAEKCG